jgi:NAD(P)H-dependent FMN reductase
MKILLLVGSGDTNSHSLSLGNAIKSQLETLGAKTELIDLHDYKLPIYDRNVERADAHDQKTKDFLAKSADVDAFVWVTPIYHNSFSAILKNALDWQHTKFPGKVVGLASNGGHRSPQAADQLLLVARALHLVTTTVRVCTDSSDYDDTLQITNLDIKSRIVDFANELVEITKKFKI